MGSGASSQISYERVVEATPEQVGNIVVSVGGEKFQEYSALFVEYQLNGKALLDSLDTLDKDLEEIGIKLGVHRKLIINFLQSLKPPSAAETSNNTNVEELMRQQLEFQKMQLELEKQREEQRRLERERERAEQQRLDREREERQRQERQREIREREARERAREEEIRRNTKIPYHPGPFRNQNWHCCGSKNRANEGCKSDCEANIRHHPGKFAPFGILAPKGWSCCGAQNNGARGCQSGPHPDQYQGGISHTLILQYAGNVSAFL